jgi:hypothetical protein
MFKDAKERKDGNKMKLVWPGAFSGLVLSLEEAIEVSNSLAFAENGED